MTTDPDRWRAIEEIFATACEAPTRDRPIVVHQLARGDRRLAEEVMSLIRAAEDSPAYLDHLAERLSLRASTGSVPADCTGRLVGPYRLTRLLGHGGMGSVYLAQRADGTFEQTVAVKLLPVGMMRPSSERRFLAERQILARMQHPHVARLLDGGVAEDRTPYFVMEWVDGLPIDEHCRHYDLPIERRLRLFLDVCGAVEAAHRNLIVHRDLKPNNVLVAADGTPKLLDFGIAKLLSADEGLTDGQPLTPAYASPEQLDGQPLTTAVDVWGLGVILYEMVAERRPFDRGALEERTPPPPPSHFRRDLSRDIDTIVLTALQTQPERRYASVALLADDVRRYLAGMPIRARAASWVYRLACGARRHPFGMSAVALIVILLGALAGVSVHSAARAREQAARIAEERDASKEVTAFLVDVFGTADPATQKGQTVTARELLDRGAARVRTELSGGPEIQATLMGTIGRVYRQLGILDPALPLLEQALADRRRIFAPPHPAIAEALRELGLARWSAGQSPEAEVLLRQSLDMWQQLSAMPDEDTVAARIALGQLLTDVGRPVEGVSELRIAVEHARRARGDAAPIVARALYHLAMALHHQGQMHESADTFRKAATMYRQLPMAPTPESAESLLMLAGLESGQAEESYVRSLYEEALEVHKRLYGVDHPKYADALRDAANVMATGKNGFARAEAQLNQAVEIYRRLPSADQAGLADALLDLGGTRARRGHLGAAERALGEALALARRAGQPLTIAMALQELARIDHTRGQLERAEDRLDEAAAIYRSALGPDSPMLLRVAMARGELAHLRGEHRVAQTFFREGLTGFEALLSPDHVRIARARLALGICLTETGHAAEARPLLVAAESRLRSAIGVDASETRRARAVLKASQ